MTEAQAKAAGWNIVKIKGGGYSANNGLIIKTAATLQELLTKISE